MPGRRSGPSSHIRPLQIAASNTRRNPSRLVLDESRLGAPHKARPEGDPEDLAPRHLAPFRRQSRRTARRPRDATSEATGTGPLQRRKGVVRSSEMDWECSWAKRRRNEVRCKSTQRASTAQFGSLLEPDGLRELDDASSCHGYTQTRNPCRAERACSQGLRAQPPALFKAPAGGRHRTKPLCNPRTLPASRPTSVGSLEGSAWR